MNLQDVTFEDIDKDQSGSVSMDEFLDVIMGKINELEIQAHGTAFIEEEDNMTTVKPAKNDTSIVKPNFNSNEDDDEDDDEYMVDLKKKE